MVEDEPPVDPNARELAVTLAAGGPRWRLREVRTKAGRAISRRAMERAVEAWREVAAIREVEAFLFSHGIGAGLAARLVRMYGSDVIAVLEDDPYRLTEVPRVGFRATRLASALRLSLGPAVLEAERAVEDEPLGCRVGVGAEVAEALELRGLSDG
jgi:hypothetical protein